MRGKARQCPFLSEVLKSSGNNVKPVASKTYVLASDFGQANSIFQGLLSPPGRCFKDSKTLILSAVFQRKSLRVGKGSETKIYMEWQPLSHTLRYLIYPNIFKIITPHSLVEKSNAQDHTASKWWHQDFKADLPVTPTIIVSISFKSKFGDYSLCLVIITLSAIRLLLNKRFSLQCRQNKRK